MRIVIISIIMMSRSSSMLIIIGLLPELSAAPRGLAPI